jgi:DNA-binding IclR family transcriptional regulator
LGVLDKAMAILAALEGGPAALADLQTATGLPRATAHRLAVALEVHGLVRRDGDGRFALGLRLAGLGRAAEARFPLLEAAWPALLRLRDETGESVQLFVRQGDRRLCVESLESPHGLRWIVPVGALLPLDRGSAGRVLAAGGDGTGPSIFDSGPSSPAASFTRSSSAGESTANRQRKSAERRWVESVEEREPGVASVSAPVRDRGQVVAAVSVSGPLERLSRSPGPIYGPSVVAAARAIEEAAGLTA